MAIGAIFILLAISILVVFFISQPFQKKTPKQEEKIKQEISHLLAERERLLDAIEELDFDFELDKGTLATDGFY